MNLRILLACSVALANAAVATGCLDGDADDACTIGSCGEDVCTPDGCIAELNGTLLSVKPASLSAKHIWDQTACPREIGPIIVTNYGDGAVTLAISGSGYGFTARAETPTIAPGDRTTVSVEFLCSPSGANGTIDINGHEVAVQVHVYDPLPR